MFSRGFATALSAAAISVYALSFAEPAASESANDAGGLEEVVVTGVRASLEAGLTIKREKSFTRAVTRVGSGNGVGG